MVRDFGVKLRITAAVLGCASQKDLCARFREVNPRTAFELDRSYKWMQGRALPRSIGLYEDWATLLGAERPAAWLQSCTVDEFLELVCGHFEVSRDALVARAGFGAGAPPEAAEPAAAAPEPRDALPGRHLVGAYACYSHAWSPYCQGKIARGSLVIEAAAGRAPKLAATYSGKVAVGRVQLCGPVTILDRAVYVDLSDDAARFRLATCLFVPGALASVLAGVMSGATFVDAIPQPAATRAVMIRIPGAGAARLESSNRYLDLDETLSSDLVALGLPVAAPAELDALLEAFLAADQPSSYIKVAAADYARLTLAIDRSFIENAASAGARPFPARARHSPHDTVRLVQG